MRLQERTREVFAHGAGAIRRHVEAIVALADAAASARAGDADNIGVSAARRGS